MKHQILFYFGILLVLATTVENQEQKHHHQYKENHEHRVHHDKSHNTHHIANRHHRSEARSEGTHKFKHLVYKEANQHCEWVCKNESAASNSSGLELEVHFNGDSKILGIVNVSSNVALLFDYSCHIIAIVNGESGSSFILDIKSQVVYHITGSSNGDQTLWLASKKSFEEYFKSLSSLDVLLKLGEKSGEKCSVGSLNESFLKELNADISSFGVSLSAEEVFKLITNESAKLGDALNGLYKGKGSFQFHHSINWFLSINLAASSLLEGSHGSLNGTSQLDLQSIFNTTSGVQALLNLFSQIGSHNDLSKLIGRYLTSPEECLNLLATASGGSNQGVDGLISIIVNIIHLMNGHGSIGAVMTSVINYNENSDEGPSLSQIVNQALNLTESQNQMFNNSAAFKGFADVLRAINNNNFVFNNVNISDIIKLVRFNNPSGVMSTIIKIFSRFIPAEGIPHFFQYFLHLLNSTQDVNILRRLMPGMDLGNLTQFGNSSVLQSILQGRNLTELFSGNSNITEVLSHIPVIGTFSNQIASAFGHGFDFNRYFNSSSIINSFEHAAHGIPFIGGFADFLSGFRNISSQIGSEIQHGFGGVGSFSNISSGIQHGIGGIGHAIQQGIGSIIGHIPGLGGASGQESGSGNSSGSGNASVQQNGSSSSTGDIQIPLLGSGSGNSSGSGNASVQHNGSSSSTGDFQIPLLGSASGGIDQSIKLLSNRKQNSHLHEKHHPHRHTQGVQEKKEFHRQHKPEEKKVNNY